MPRKRKTQNSVNPGFKNLQLVIDAEMIERCNGWQNVITAFSNFINSEKPSGSIHECYTEFKTKYVAWLDYMKSKDPEFEIPMAEGELFYKNGEEMTEEEFERFVCENYHVDQKFIDAGYFVQDTQTGVKPDGTIGEINNIRITEKGLKWIKEQLAQGGANAII